MNEKIYNCNKTYLTPPPNFIPFNCAEGYKDVIKVDKCLADEIQHLWKQGIKTAVCCCGHGYSLGFIEVFDESIPKMEKLGYIHYIYPQDCGGSERKDAFIPKSYGHIYNGYSEGYLG